MTAWPLIWTTSPASPNWEGTVGNSLNFSVSAIPDPTFPDTWDYGDGVTPIPLPPQPTNISLQVVNTNFEDNDYTIVGNTMTITIDDVIKFLPFTSIKFEKDNQVYQVQYEQELRDIGFDFVFEFIPYPGAFETRYISLRASSTSINDLNGTFNFQINNNFDAVRSALKQILQESESFLSSLTDGDGTPSDYDDPEENTVDTVIPTFGGSYVEPDYDTLFPSEEQREIDKYVRDNNMEEVEKRIGDGSGIKKTPRPLPTKNVLGTTNPDDDDLSDWFDNLGK